MQKEDFMKRKYTFFVNKENSLKDFKKTHDYQIVEEYLEKREKECEKNFTKFC